MVCIFLGKDINHCPVRIIDKYMSLCPAVTDKTKKSNFYLQSLEKTNQAQWYEVQPVGKNTLSKVVGKLLKSGNLDGYFTKHSLRHTSTTRLFQVGVDKKIIKEIIGHTSDVLVKYQVTSLQQKEVVSKILKNETTPNKKPRGFMQSCFPMSVYFKCLREFLLYFYKSSTSMAFT